MPFHVACPTCGNVMAVPEGTSGQQVACPTCQHAMTVPPMPPPAMARAKPVTPSQSTRKHRDEEPPRRSRRDDWDDKPEPRRRRLKLYQPSKQAYIVGAVAVAVQLAIGAAFIVLDVGVKYMDAMEARPEIGKRRDTTSNSSSGRPPSGVKTHTVRSPMSTPQGWIVGKSEDLIDMRFASPIALEHQGPLVDKKFDQIEFWTDTHPAKYSVMSLLFYNDQPQSLEAYAEEMFDTFRKRAGNNREESQAAINVDGFPGREALIRSPQATVGARVFMKDKHAITVFVFLSPNVPFDAPEIRAFLDSIRFTK